MGGGIFNAHAHRIHYQYWDSEVVEPFIGHAFVTSAGPRAYYGVYDSAIALFAVVELHYLQ